MVKPAPAANPFAEVLKRAASRDARERVASLLGAAGRAISSLADLDLKPFESDAVEEGSADLAAFNEIAPALGQTFQAVQELLQVVQDTFPPAEEEGGDDDMDLEFGEAKGHIDEEPVWDAPAKPGAPSPDDAELPPPLDPLQDAIDFIHAISGGMRADMAELGRRIREPQVVANRWNLVVELQAFRGKMRSGAGEMVFRLCSAFAPVKRTEVVPEYREEQKNGALLRRTLGSLYYEFDGLNRRVQAAGPDDLAAALGAVRDGVEKFAGTPAYVLLRPLDKRAFIDFYKRISNVLSASPVRGGKEEVEGFSKFMESILVINRRATLVDYDRQALAAASRKLETAEERLDRDPAGAAAEFEEAFKRVRAVFGRDMALDRVIAAWARKLPPPQQGIAELRERIAAVPL